MGGFITEKFALLNLLKALSALSPEKEKKATPQNSSENSPAENSQIENLQGGNLQSGNLQVGFNAMASVLERHEKISNRVRGKN